MANATQLATMITRRIVRDFENSLAFVKNVDRQYDDQYKTSGAKDGDPLRIRLPNKYTVATGKTLQISDNKERYVTLNRATQKHVAINFSMKEVTTDIDNFDKRILKPAMNQLGSNVDSDALSMVKGIYNLVGTAGTVPASAQVWLDAGAVLDDYATPRDMDRAIVLSPAAQARTVDGLKGLFEAGDKIADQYRGGTMARALGFKWAMDQNSVSITTGTRVGTILVDTPLATEAAYDATTSTIHIDGLTNATDTVKQGEVFTVAGVYGVNPLTGDALPSLQQFVVTADATAASNEVDLIVKPALRATGPYKTVSALPANDAAVAFFGSASTAYRQNVAFWKDAFAFATIDLEMPEGVAMAAREQMNNLSMRFVRAYDINNDNLPGRIDILYGYVIEEERFAVRVSH